MSFLTGKSGNLWNVQFQKNPEVNAFHSFSLPADQKSLSFLQFLPNFPINSSLFHKIGAIKVVKNVTYPGTVDEERNVDL